MRGEGRPPRAVVDTNIFVSAAITKRGTPSHLLTLWKAGRFVLLISEEQRTELADVLARPEISQRYRLSEQEIASLFLVLDTFAVPVPLSRRIPVYVRDPKDEHMLAAALRGKADYLVTGDEDLLELDRHPRLPELRIVTPTAFVDLLTSM